MKQRFGVISDPHITLPHTVPPGRSSFLLTDVSLAAFEIAVKHLAELGIDFLLIPGDLTRDGEVDNHSWLRDMLAGLPFPTYVIPGNHDVPVPQGENGIIGWHEFPQYYQNAGYGETDQLYYTCSPAAGLRLIALNSNQFDSQGRQVGCLDDAQLSWLTQVLAAIPKDELILVMVHHNLLEHWPGQGKHPMGLRYMLDNRRLLLELLHQAEVSLVFTGHLHVQDIAYEKGIYEITTGSLVSYPHPYRLVELNSQDNGGWNLDIQSFRVEATPHYPDLQTSSRKWMGDRSAPFLIRFLMAPPLNLDEATAQALVPDLKDFWPQIAAGDPRVNLPDLPADWQTYFARFNHQEPPGCPHLGDNAMEIQLPLHSSRSEALRCSS
ncbi:metallophosphoesterase [Candidatus Synechococcus calcipolaris G9]|uniref:Metallophosphoesterase n=1 Tax=Candidatus Synechococcus calcipolaris G9 TaxID=1497997 RepID=A0ABT6EXE5_9SYNE|nr:metallophosphoesterase [Candidatus Synechococcus calcipolaris]MDG2990480.1 metallophosphoesterase [Candidatus Synechococcus calcipolaris G9]